MWDNSQVNARCANNHVFYLFLVIILIYDVFFLLFKYAPFILYFF